MRSKTAFISGLLAAVVGLALAGCDGSNPVLPDPAPMPMGSGSAIFEVSGSGGSQMISYSSGLNTVVCSRNAGWASLFIRFAEQTQAGGNMGPHLDLDLCNHSGGGTFRAKDPAVAACGSAKTWNLFWHGADGTVYSNLATASNCELQIDEMGTQLMGSFSCQGLVENGGARTVDILNGTFDCTETA